MNKEENIKTATGVRENNRETKLNPHRKGGIRNVFCPYYSECLDFVIKKQWLSWGCMDCAQRHDESGKVLLQVVSEQAVPYFEIGIRSKLSLGQPRTGAGKGKRCRGCPAISARAF